MARGVFTVLLLTLIHPHRRCSGCFLAVGFFTVCLLLHFLVFILKNGPLVLGSGFYWCFFCGIGLVSRLVICYWLLVFMLLGRHWLFSVRISLVYVHSLCLWFKMSLIGRNNCLFISVYSIRWLVFPFHLCYLLCFRDLVEDTCFNGLRFDG